MPNPESFVFLPQGDDFAKSITPSCVSSIWGEQESSFDSASSGSWLSELDTCSEVTADDDYIAGLAQQMAEYIIQDDDNQPLPKTWALATSPQSTLRSPFPVKEEKERFVGGVPETEYPQLQVAKKGNNKKVRKQKRPEIQDSENKERPKPPPQPYPVQQQPAAATRAVFLAGSGHRSGSPGTGVFLPRGDRSNNPSQSRKKLGCSRVVIPARVAQALKLHFDHVSKPKSITRSAGDDLQLDTCNNENENDGSQLEVALPQEWTY